MTRIFKSDAAASDAGLPDLVRFADVEAAFAALPWRGWYSAWNPAYRTDASGAVSQLTDRTGNGRHLVQATGANRPPVAENFFGSVNGTERDGMTFNGTSSYSLATSGNFFDTTGDWTYVALVVPSGTTQRTVISSGSLDVLMQLNSTTWRLNSTQHSVQFQPTIQNQMCALIATVDQGASTSDLYLECNGVSASTVFAGTNVAPGNNPLTMGMRSGGAQLFPGVIAEFAAGPFIADSGQKQVIRDYLAQLYNPRA